MRQYYEYEGGYGADAQWKSIIERQNTPLVEVAMWNDYTESSYFQPTRVLHAADKGMTSFPHLGYYELTKYYIKWYKTGRAPAITKDAIFYFYRTQPKDAVAPNDSTTCDKPIRQDKLFGNVQDDIYVTTALTKPAILHVVSGGASYNIKVGAGIQHTKVPFTPGHQTFEIVRHGEVLTHSQGTDIDSAPQYKNFGNTSGYSVVGGSNSDNWLPSDKWQTGYNSDWFK